MARRVTNLLSWIALIDILVLQLSTVMILAYAPKPAMKLRIGVFILALCLAMHIHWSFPYTDLTMNRLAPTAFWFQVLHVGNVLAITKVEYLQEMNLKIKLGEINEISFRPWSRIAWACGMIWNARWIGTRWRDDPKRRVPTRKRAKLHRATNGNHVECKKEETGRWEFVVKKLKTAIAMYLVMDLLGLPVMQTGVDPSFFSVDKQYIFRRTNHITLEELGFRTGAVMGFGLTAFSMITLMSSLPAAVMVGLGLNEPEEWPTLFGHISDAWSIRQFWSVAWHQYFRRSFVCYSEFIAYKVLHIPKPNKILARYARVMTVFVVSGLLHIMTDNALGIPFRESGALSFFATQALGIMFEDVVLLVHRSKDEQFHHGPKSWTSRSLGYIWTAAFMVWAAPVWLYPMMRYAPPTKLRTVPFSVLSALFG
ncbi:predicted protein [Uncinocarpus reesii 1704]|uniref:Wax synthase domain-containing protein n=1 Tax=Uncinocarpus reesii (strain UAMH 1704) TaxID=336963 RepID=C4JIX8_UNCRE|nr:uncharacterized protein UREG_01585 [Uncinocarpus reesii 1704]EEP76736.1 predicted protein [Uncinocarpus reesii 1704]